MPCILFPVTDMCGIAGFFSTKPRGAGLATQMMRALQNRGPDAQHYMGWGGDWQQLPTAPGAPGPVQPMHNALVHARLSIIDPRPIADQPMANDDGSIWICYNGEVYDWAHHADELRAAGAVFKTRSDTEFILRAYEHWGIDMLPRLRGMFAIVIVDLRINKVWLVRDRMGLKPILYAQVGDDFAFGSTVRSVLPFLPDNERMWDASAIDAYLAHRYIPAPRTIFKQIRRLPNAHWLCFDLQTRQTQVQEYWQPPSEASRAPVPDERWLQTLDSAVHMRTVADRPLGVFLSSGIDSSTVASRLVATGHAGLQSFTARFALASMDESPLAATIAKQLGLPNLAVDIPLDIERDLDRIIADLDEPFADPSALPSWYLARETTKHVKVVLGGDGGDEMFGGYKRLRKHTRTAWRRYFLGGNNTLPRLGDIAGDRTSRLLDEARFDWTAAYSLRFSGFTPTQRKALQPGFKIQSPHYWRGLEPKWLKTLAPLSVLLEIDRLNYLPEYILRKGDLCTMAHGLELRAPLLDHAWVGLVSTMPASQRFTEPAKQLLAKAMPQLGSVDLFAQKKKGFNPPLNDWLQRDLRERLDAMPHALEAVSGGHLGVDAPAELLRLYRLGNTQYAEQLLQLLFLQISMSQLDALRREAAC